MPRHFLTLLDLSPAELDQIIDRAIELKALSAKHQNPKPFDGRLLAMIFEKSSTRTRVSFESGVAQLGGDALFLSPRDTQLGRGEPISDSAKVISRMVDMVMIRTFDHSTIETFAEHSRVPVINALTDQYDPCQLLADLPTHREHCGSIEGKRVVWVGDGNNMCASYINAARQANFELHIAVPEGYDPDSALLEANADRVKIFRDPVQAVAGADLVVTDVWASMGQEEEQAKRERDFAGFMVDRQLMSHANSDALYMHCLPAHRGEEISAELMDDPKTVIWDEAENRLHAQKALMEFLLSA